MIRRDLQSDGTILVRSWLRTELHGPDGSIIEGRNTTDAERAEHEAWEAANPVGGGPLQAPDPPSEPTPDPDPGTYRSAVTGEFVTAAYAAANPDTTVRVDLETVQALRARVAELEAQLEQA